MQISIYFVKDTQLGDRRHHQYADVPVSARGLLMSFAAEFSFHGELQLQSRTSNLRIASLPDVQEGLGVIVLQGIFYFLK